MLMCVLSSDLIHQTPSNETEEWEAQAVVPPGHHHSCKGPLDFSDGRWVKVIAEFLFSWEHVRLPGRMWKSQ